MLARDEQTIGVGCREAKPSRHLTPIGLRTQTKKNWDLTLIGLRSGTETCLEQLQTDPQVKGLLLWLLDRPMPFPMDLTVPKFNAIRQALSDQDLQAFEPAALAVIGLGQGLTPSGDDFLDGIIYAAWWCEQRSSRERPSQLGSGDDFASLRCTRPQMFGLIPRLLQACQERSHPKSAALMADLIAGKSTGPLKAMLQALSDNDAARIQAATHALYAVGSNSGADMLAGVLMYLQTYVSTYTIGSTIPSRCHSVGSGLGRKNRKGASPGGFFTSGVHNA